MHQHLSEPDGLPREAPVDDRSRLAQIDLRDTKSALRLVVILPKCSQRGHKAALPPREHVVELSLDERHERVPAHDPRCERRDVRPKLLEAELVVVPLRPYLR